MRAFIAYFSSFIPGSCPISCTCCFYKANVIYKIYCSMSLPLHMAESVEKYKVWDRAKMNLRDRFIRFKV